VIRYVQTCGGDKETTSTTPFDVPLPLTRKDLGRWLKAQGYQRGAEVGVEQGKFAEVLCRAGLELLCVDPWRAWPDYRTHLDQAEWDRLMAVACERLAPYPAKIVRATSVEAAQDVPDDSLDFVYIDGKHDWESVELDIVVWREKVRDGGMICGHDWNLGSVKQGFYRVFTGPPLQVTVADRSPSWMVRA